MHTFYLTTKATSYASRRLAKAAVKILSETISDRDILFNFDLALSEACANVVRHAYREIEPQELEIIIRLCPGRWIELEISDWGHGFPHWPVEPKNPEPEAEGGRGLYIMSELSDMFEVRQHEGKNTIYIKVLVKDELWKPLE